MPFAQSTTTFIIYSQLDYALKNELTVHLRRMVLDGKIAQFKDQALTDGMVWDDEIKTQIRSADIILLLVSTNLLLSRFLINEEINIAALRSKQNQAILIPVLLNRVNLTSEPILSDLIHLPTNQIPIVEHSNRDSAWLDIIDELNSSILQFSKFENLPKTKLRIEEHYKTNLSTQDISVMNLQDYANEYLGNSKELESMERQIKKKNSIFSKFASLFKQSLISLNPSFFSESLISTVCWQTIIASSGFNELLLSNGASPAALNKNNYIVVGHDDNNEHIHNLIVFDPIYSKAQPTTIEIILSDIDLEDSWLRLRSIFKYDKKPYNTFTSAIIKSTTINYLKQRRFKVLLTKSPSIMPTSNGLSSDPINVSSIPLGLSPFVGASPNSTVGVFASDILGRKGVTICWHALSKDISLIVQDETIVEVNGQIGTIRSIDHISDSCFVELHEPLNLNEPIRVNGPLSGVSPRSNEIAYFCGLKSNKKSTKIIGWSLDLPLVQPFSQLKVFTTPETNPGDSGAALIDSSGNVIGFAFYRTGIGEEPGFSAWIWADSVFQFHNLS